MGVGRTQRKLRLRSHAGFICGREAIGLRLSIALPCDGGEIEGERGNAAPAEGIKVRFARPRIQCVFGVFPPRAPSINIVLRMKSRRGSGVCGDCSTSMINRRTESWAKTQSWYSYAPFHSGADPQPLDPTSAASASIWTTVSCKCTQGLYDSR